jgi:hypothetical protein
MLILGDVAPNVRKFLLEGILTQNLWRILHNSQNEILRCYKFYPLKNNLVLEISKERDT